MNNSLLDSGKPVERACADFVMVNDTKVVCGEPESAHTPEAARMDVGMDHTFVGDSQLPVVIDKRRVSLDRPLTPEDMTDGSLSTLERASILRRPQAEQVSLLLEAINGRALGEKILVLLLPPDDRYGSVLIPEIAREDQVCGIVVSVGKGHYENGVLVPPEVRPGNYVAFSKYAARMIQVGTHEVASITEADINFAAGQ